MSLVLVSSTVRACMKSMFVQQVGRRPCLHSVCECLKQRQKTKDDFASLLLSSQGPYEEFETRLDTDRMGSNLDIVQGGEPEGGRRDGVCREMSPCRRRKIHVFTSRESRAPNVVSPGPRVRYWQPLSWSAPSDLKTTCGKKGTCPFAGPNVVIARTSGTATPRLVDSLGLEDDSNFGNFGEGHCVTVCDTSKARRLQQRSRWRAKVLDQGNSRGGCNREAVELA